MPNPRSTVAIGDHPLYAMLVPVPFVCFLVTFFTDWTYAETANMQWANMSAWMLTAGLVVSIPTVIVGLIDFLREPRIRAFPAAWIHAIGYAIILVLSIFNAFVHSRDAYTSVVPMGLTLSAIVAVIVLVTAWTGGTLVYRHRVGVAPEDRP